MSVCQKCEKRTATRRVRIVVEEERAPAAELEYKGPVWSMDAATCAVCAAELGMLIASQTVGSESN
jgi:hypothetical protein